MEHPECPVKQAPASIKDTNSAACEREQRTNMNWLYDEQKHCGVDYSKVSEADVYDEQHENFRNYEKEFEAMMDFLELSDPEDKIIVDLGCGTGATAIFAADRFKTVYAVDISGAMIEKAKEKPGRTFTNLKFVVGGFLSYEHEGGPVDLVATKAAFHHLPDFWKQIALLRINRMLKMGGLLYIHDVVFQFDPQEYISKINEWISRFGKIAGENFMSEVETHIRDEYSTFGWIMKGMIERAGFAVGKCRSNDFITEYACRKIDESAKIA